MLQKSLSLHTSFGITRDVSGECSSARLTRNCTADTRVLKLKTTTTTKKPKKKPKQKPKKPPKNLKGTSDLIKKITHSSCARN